MMSELKDNTVSVSYNGVLYADGGFYSTERAGGWGLHGYVFSPEASPESNKGSGVPGSTPTVNGYSDSKDETKAVVIKNYVDSFGGVPGAGSNNHTELLAAKEALTYALDKGLSHTLIYSDSKYVVNGINQYLDRWKQTGWRNRDGDEISNRKDWEAVDSLLSRLRDANNQVTLTWIKGHNGHIGNEKADQWASKGNCIGLNDLSVTYKFEEQPEGYWKSTVNYNRMLDQPKWYFSSDKTDRQFDKDGRHIYWTGQHGDDEDVAKPQSDSSNAVLFLKEPIDVLERVRDHFVKKDDIQVGHLYIGAMRTLTNAAVTEDIIRFGLGVFKGNKANHSLQTDKRAQLIHHATPTGLYFYNVDNLSAMTTILKQYLDGDKSIISTDLTDLLYESIEKKGKVTRKLRKEITNTVKHLDVSVNFNTAVARELRAMTVVPFSKTKVRLIMGSDIIGRNALSALADVVKRVEVLTWRESDSVFRYATVIETDDDIGLWTNPFGNFKLVK